MKKMKEKQTFVTFIATDSVYDTTDEPNPIHRKLGVNFERKIFAKIFTEIVEAVIGFDQHLRQVEPQIRCQLLEIL